MGTTFLIFAQAAAPSESLIQSLLHTEKLIPVIAIVGGLTCATLWAAMHYFYSWIELCKNNELKLRMVEAGHSAEEIERVVWAGKLVDESEESKKPARQSRRAIHIPPAKPIPQHVA